MALSGVRAWLDRWSIASLAGFAAVAALLGALAFGGGYVGLAAERAGAVVDAQSRAAAIGAGLAIDRVTARGLSRIEEEELLAAIGPAIGASIVHFNVRDARGRVEALGWARAAAVSRLWPNTIHVSVRERAPAAVWQMEGAFRLIDDAGAVIAPIESSDYAHLPLVVGAGAPERAGPVLVALNGRPDLAAVTAALVRVGERRWNLRLRGGVDILLPEHDVSAALTRLSALDDAYGLLDRDLEYIDLRDPERFVFREAAGEERAGDG